ncbi:MAG: glycosyltransferase family 2 protein [Flavobacteriales bacterium]
MKKISIVVPAYNEAGNLELLYHRVMEVWPTDLQAEFIFVDDGSNDGSLQVIRALNAKDKRVRYISFSRNFGHQQALKAGIDHAYGDAVIMMDADLQHPPALIPGMIAKWKEGNEVVYTVRKNDPSLGVVKKQTSRGFYRWMNRLSGLKLEEGTADFRLIDKRVANEVRKMNDPYLFLRGLIPWMGFSQHRIEYTPEKRHSGKTKYSFFRMLKFALNGITSFSVKPLHLATLLGLIISSLAFIYGIYAVCMYLFTDQTTTGWASTLASILFIGGIQLIILGIIGEYLGKIYMQLKQRPNYIIREASGAENEKPV